MIVVKSKYSGFCFGVKRAVAEAYKLEGENNYILGEIIHNELVNSNLEKRGIKILDSLFDAELSDTDTVLIRTHGEGKSTFDKLESFGVNIIDCTCPFVKDIQKIVEKHYRDGYKIVIIGNSSHPEVVGINGWCGDCALITENAIDLSNIKEDKICIVVQTTYSREKFETLIKNFTFSKAKTVDIFNTICYTTTKRQREAEFIASECEAMIVLGGAKSNNTQKLFDICSSKCANVFRIISPADFDYRKIKNYNKVGIVFGASTPDEQFQEVISNMENITEEIIIENPTAIAEEQVETTKDEMKAAFENIKPSKDFRIGQIVSATVSSVNEDGLSISLNNSKKDLELPKSEMINDCNADNYKVGEAIRVMVIAKKPVKFSEKAMVKVLAEEAEIEEIKAGKIFEATIDAVNKGGLTGTYNSYQVFVPASQIKLGFVKDLNKYVGKTLRLKAEKVEVRRHQIVASQRVILAAEKEERDAIKAQKEAEFFGAIQEGDVIVGTPVRFAAFGAFVDVNGFDCLAHISDLSWTGCKDCAEVLEIGKEYEFKILKIDEEKKRVSIGYKQLQPRPWDTVLEKYAVGDVINGKVVRIVSFGAFVEIEKGIDGLVHVSQISNKWLENPLSALQVGQDVEAKIMNIDTEKEKINLSIKALLPDEPVEEVVEDEKKPAKGKKRAAKKEENDDDLREWKDDANGGASIAEMINLDK